MNRNFQTTSKLARSALAIAAVCATLLVGASIEGLVDHYQGATQMASQAPVVVAQR